jgi:CheY-like chemotaxis protein
MNSENYPLPPVILVVDDQPQIRMLIQDFLCDSGFQVLVAESGPAAEQLAENYPDTIHMLITDLEMPGMDGIKLAQRLKKQRPDMEVIYMSGNLEKLWQQEHMLVAGGALLEKPVSLDRLGAVVSELLPRTTAL